jgi:hypothetical protein
LPGEAIGTIIVSWHFSFDADCNGLMGQFTSTFQKFMQILSSPLKIGCPGSRSSFQLVERVKKEDETAKPEGLCQFVDSGALVGPMTFSGTIETQVIHLVALLHIPTSKKVLKGSYATQPFLLTFAPDLKNTLCK